MTAREFRKLAKKLGQQWHIERNDPSKTVFVRSHWRKPAPPRRNVKFNFGASNHGRSYAAAR